MQQSMQRMHNNMMNSMFSDPFAMMGAPAIMGTHQSMQGPQRLQGMQGMQVMPAMPEMPGMGMLPFGFPQMPNMSQMFSSFVRKLINLFF